MRLKRCTECGDYAAVSSEGGRGTRLLCLDCMDKEHKDPSLDRYICSVMGCDNAPDYLVSIDEGEFKSFLLCESHFKKGKPQITAYMSLPRWLMNDSDLVLTEEGLTIEMDFTAKGDP